VSTFKNRLRLPSPAMAIAVIALVLGLAGSAYAVKKITAHDLAKNSVKTKKIVDGAVATSKLGDSSVTTPKLDAAERSEAFQTSQSESIPLSTAGGPFTDADRVATLTVPATTPPNSRFVVTAQVNLASAGGVGIVQCALRDDGTVVSRGSATLPGVTEFSQSIALTGVVDGGAVDLACQSATPGQARSRVLIANRVATATTP
jgi:hypothetical protein